MFTVNDRTLTGPARLTRGISDSTRRPATHTDLPGSDSDGGSLPRFGPWVVNIRGPNLRCLWLGSS